MKNLPEKIYFNKQAAKRSIEFCSIQNIKNGSDNTDVVEYIRSDIAEQIAKDFAMISALHLVGCENGSLKINNFDDLFTEFINSQKK